MVLGFFDHLEHAPQAKVAGLRVELGANVVLGAVAGAGARWIASSIASMTMPLSISFSRATASAIASNSALLALTAAGAVAM